MVFLIKARFDLNTAWDKAYFVWEFTKDVLLFLALFFKYRTLRAFIRPVLFFTVIRLCYEITKLCSEIPNNSAQEVITLWIALTATMVIISVKELIRDLKRAKDQC